MELSSLTAQGLHMNEYKTKSEAENLSGICMQNKGKMNEEVLQSYLDE